MRQGGCLAVRCGLSLCECQQQSKAGHALAARLVVREQAIKQPVHCLHFLEVKVVRPRRGECAFDFVAAKVPVGELQLSIYFNMKAVALHA